jgi:hypothetical protein
MEVNAYGQGNSNDGPEEIHTFKDLPDTAKGKVYYFWLILNKRNKNGTLIVFHVFTEHSHITLRKQMEKDVKECNLAIHWSGQTRVNGN